LPQSNATGGLDSSLEDKPYMYLSHYSTPGIVLYYLIRNVPSYLLTIQNEGYGGPPDRVFHDVSLSWLGGCMKVLADNKELIPEFYFGDGSFLVNLNQVELGLNHLEERVNDVTVPLWANTP
jgi:factor associated with neutral sphingomyelinase activation